MENIQGTEVASEGQDSPEQHHLASLAHAVWVVLFAKGKDASFAWSFFCIFFFYHVKTKWTNKLLVTCTRWLQYWCLKSLLCQRVQGGRIKNTLLSLATLLGSTNALLQHFKKKKKTISKHLRARNCVQGVIPTNPHTRHGCLVADVVLLSTKAQDWILTAAVAFRCKTPVYLALSAH